MAAMVAAISAIMNNQEKVPTNSSILGVISGGRNPRLAIAIINPRVHIFEGHINRDLKFSQAQQVLSKSPLRLLAAGGRASIGRGGGSGLGAGIGGGGSPHGRWPRRIGRWHGWRSRRWGRHMGPELAYAGNASRFLLSHWPDIRR
jgi:hypothetical protein